MLFKEIKALFAQASLITIYTAPVKTKISQNHIFLEWRGTDTGQKFDGYITSFNLEEIKFANDFKNSDLKFLPNNLIAIKLGHISTQNRIFSTWYNSNYTPICFWHLVGMPVK